MGLDNAGKTVAAKNLAGEDVEAVVPTIGFSIVHLSYRDYKVSLFDLGGGSNIRGIWNKYFVYVRFKIIFLVLYGLLLILQAHGVIFVVDSSDFRRLDEAREVLHNLLSHDKIAGKPLIVLANKQDSEDALDEIDIIEKLQLESIVNKKQCPTLVESCAATEMTSKSKLDPGIKKGYHWLLNYIIREYDDLNKRVESDVVEQEDFEKQVRFETMKRLQLLNEKTRPDDDVIELYSEYDRKINGIKSEINNRTHDIKEAFSDSGSLTSEESLPQVYHVNVEENHVERPKSAVQMVKEQLALEHSKRRSSLKKTISSNKTVPANFYGVKLPHSANTTRKDTINPHRNLKSAGDSIFIVSNTPTTVPPNESGDAFQSNLFRVNNFEDKTKLPPLKTDEKRNDFTLAHAFYDENAISIVDVD